jgi:hypothetical protein
MLPKPLKPPSIGEIYTHWPQNSDSLNAENTNKNTAYNERRNFKNISIYIRELPPTPSRFRDKYHRAREPTKEANESLPLELKEPYFRPSASSNEDAMVRARVRKPGPTAWERYRSHQICPLSFVAVPARPNTLGFIESYRNSQNLYLSRSVATNRYVPSNQSQGRRDFETGSLEKIEQWISDIDKYETTLEEMAAATLDQGFKEELSVIEQWFRSLSEAERTATLYALIQQITQIQILFFIQVMQQMRKGHPMSSILSPADSDKG